MLKAVAVVLLLFSVVSIPISIVGELYLSKKVFGSSRTEMFGGAFEDSLIFSNLFSKRIGQLAEYIELKNILETNGELDYNRSVCEMVEDGSVAVYAIGDLLRRNHFFVEDVNSQSEILLEELFAMGYQQDQSFVYIDEDGAVQLGKLLEDKFIYDFNSESNWIAVKKVEDAKALFSEQKENIDTAAGFMQNTALESADAEGYSEAKSVYIQQTAMGEEGLPEGSILVFTLDDLSYRYTYYVAYYLYYHGIFAENVGTRFIYEISNGTNTYANAEDIAEYQSGEKRASGRLSYNSREYTVDTDVKNVNRSYVDNLERALSTGKDEVNIFAAVRRIGSDTLVNDLFMAEQIHYQDMQQICVILLVGGIAGAFGVIVLGFYLLASAGHAKDVEGVRLTVFDRWYTEIAGVLCFCLLLSCIILTLSLIREAYEGVYIDGSLIASTAAICTMVMFTYLAFIFSLASLVRRIKAGTLWKNSFLRNGTRWLYRTCRKLVTVFGVIYEERDITARVIIAYVTVLAATVITGVLIMVSFWSGTVLVLFFLLLFAGIHAGTLYMLLREKIDYKRLIEGIERMADGDLNYKIDEMGLQTDNKRLAVAANRIGDGLAEAVEKSIKDERMKTDLITNVSHDIKTPLTSIINYVDLLKREKIEDNKIQSYIDVLDSKSQRLKNLTDDLVEASKLSSGNIILTMQDINLVELVNQANGEFSEKFELKNLTIISSLPESPVIIEADGRRIWRVLENLYNNVSKYAMENTRVYVAVVPVMDRASFIIKNISANPLNFSAEELTERFIRGDISRSTEGSGLGLSIAQSLTELMKGSFEIYLDGDLFRATVSFPLR